MSKIRIKILLRSSIVNTYIVDIADKYFKTNNVSAIGARVARDLILENIIPFTKSGKLLQSFKMKVIDSRNSQVYSNLVYSRIQDLGGRIKITDKMRKKMFVLYRKTRDKKYLAIAITKKKYVKIPKKNFTKLNRALLRKEIMKNLR